MLDKQFDFAAVQVCLLNWLCDEAERKWAVENAKQNSEQECAECEARREPRAPQDGASPKAPARHWPPHRRFWHRSPREWREDRVKVES